MCLTHPIEIYKTIFKTGDHLRRINVRDQIIQKKISLFSNNFFLILSATLFSAFWRLTMILEKPDQTWTLNVNMDIKFCGHLFCNISDLTDVTAKDKEKQRVDRSLLLGKVP